MTSTTYPHVTDASETWAKDPFVDPRVSLDSNWSNPARQSTTTASSSFISRSSTDAQSYSVVQNGQQGWNQDERNQDREYLTTDNRGPIVSSNTPNRPRGNTLQVSNELNDALSQELDHNPSDREMLKAERTRDRVVSGTSSRSARRESSGESRDGFWQQLRTGTGWFSPVVPPEPVLSREEREQKERARIDKLKNSGQGSTRSARPSFMKRMSSGVEMLGFGGGANSASGGSTSPRKR
ncbi:hypothetical protein ACM66B_006752 [Microbotryomycetes sp. NB124-2]